MKKKRILFISNHSRLGGGTTSYLLTLVEHARDEFDCAVVSNRHHTQLADALKTYSIPCYGLRDQFSLFYSALIALIAFRGYDLIYANGANEHSLWAYRAAKLTRKPFIWHIHESVKHSQFIHGLQYANAVIANSHDTAANILKLSSTSKPVVIPCGADLRLFAQDKQVAKNKLTHDLGLNPEWTRVVNVGRIFHDKNQMDVLRIAPEILAKFPMTYFIFVGPIKDPDRIISIIRGESQPGAHDQPRLSCLAAFSTRWAKGTIW